MASNAWCGSFRNISSAVNMKSIYLNKLVTVFFFLFSSEFLYANSLDELKGDSSVSSFISNGTFSKPIDFNNDKKVINENSLSETYQEESRKNILLPGESNVRDLLPSSGENLPPPYGANLFAGGYESERLDGLNDNYVISSGDKINIWLWGAVNYSNVVTVDNQGNIFIPEIGPIKVKNLRASDVNDFVTTKIKKVYTKNVSVYTQST